MKSGPGILSHIHIYVYMHAFEVKCNENAGFTHVSIMDYVTSACEVHPTELGHKRTCGWKELQDKESSLVTNLPLLWGRRNEENGQTFSVGGKCGYCRNTILKPLSFSVHTESGKLYTGQFCHNPV